MHNEGIILSKVFHKWISNEYLSNEWIFINFICLKNKWTIVFIVHYSFSFNGMLRNLLKAAWSTSLG